MQRALAPALLVVTMLAGLSVLRAQEAAPREGTVRGEVVDVLCQRSDASHRGDAHVDCALSCARKGAVLGVLTADGALYVITGEFTTEANRRLVPFVARDVVATGEIGETEDRRTIRITAIDLAPAES
jgi:hypothetical protein